MKKVLIVSNLFHSSPRVPAIAKRLKEFGWESTVLTVTIEKDPKHLLALPRGFKDVRLIETHNPGDVLEFWRRLLIFLGFRKEKSLLTQVREKTGKISRKSFTDRIFILYTSIFAYPDEERKWEKIALKAGRDILRKEKFNAIISSSSPVITHLVAKKLKKEFNLPWVADFRDLWTLNHNYFYPSWRKFFETRLELKILKTSDALVTVSMPLVDNLKKLHVGKEVYNITNGFDPDKVNEPSAPLIPKFTITYTGQIYLGEGDTSVIWSSLKDLILEGIMDKNDLEIRFYGPEMNWVQKLAEEYGLGKNFKQYGKILREDVLKKQRESQLLLLLGWSNKEMKGVYTGKVFEYLAAKRPILAIGSEKGDVIDDLLLKTKSGIQENDKDKLKEAIKGFYLEYKEKGEVSYKGNWDEVNKFSHRRMAEKFANVLNKIS